MQKKHIRNGLNYKGALNDKINITFAVTEKSIQRLRKKDRLPMTKCFLTFRNFNGT